MALWERIQQIWRDASPQRRALLAGGPIVVIAAIAVIVAVVVASGGGDGDGETVTGSTPTPRASATPAGTATGVSGGAKTPIAVSPGEVLTAFDLAQRGNGTPARGEFQGDRLIIEKIGVDAPFTVKVVPPPPTGQMANPNGPEDVAYYDFSAWEGLGGLPNAGGNVVMAGHVDYIDYGQAVFWDLDKLVVGDRVQIRMKDGTVVEYAVEFNKRIDAETAIEEKLWDAIVAGTADESITLITCEGTFSGGHYSDRRILWGRRVT
jgi:LPXTG-site transpeptidase (sortase) family protein